MPTAWVSSGGASSTRTNGRPAYASRNQRPQRCPALLRAMASCRGKIGVQREIDAPHERPRVGHEPHRGVGPADPLPPALQNLGLVPVSQHRVGEEVVRPHRDGASSACGCTPAPLEPVTAKRDGVTSSRPARADTARAAPRWRSSPVPRWPGAAELGSDDVGQPVAEPAHQRGRRMRAVVLLVQRQILNPEVGREIHDQSGPGVEYFSRHSRRLAVLEAEEHDIRPRAASPGRGAREARVGERRQAPDDVADRLARPGSGWWRRTR